jgi:hypothetical protein
MSPELPHHHSGLKAQMLPPGLGLFERTPSAGGMCREWSDSLKGSEL